jgi:ABC-type polysaccharide/polyol phosphate export permease
MRTLSELWRYREVLLNFVRRDLKKRYKSSVLGFFWSFLNPLFQILVFWVVFKYLAGTGEKNYTVTLFAAFLPWTFFSQAVLDGATCVAEHVGLLKKVYFPRLMLPLTSFVANGIHFFLGLLVLALFFAVVRVTVNWRYLGPALLALVIQCAITLGLTLIISSLSVFYTDIKYLMQTIMQMWLFLSPILIPPAKVLGNPGLPALAKKLYLMNPMAPVLVAYRSIIPLNEPWRVLGDVNYSLLLSWSAGFAVILLAVGIIVFRRLEWTMPLQG